MTPAGKSVNATEAKAKLLQLMTQVERKRQPITITRNGKPSVVMMPVPLESKDPIFGFYQGKLRIVSDLDEPLYSDAELENFAQRTLDQLA